ncbi:MAG: hypothetical protein NZ455_08415 [Bacteroidia bacterium]|nr:hypothetical protein [Bacteroidia bacterium]MDW8345492.1 hypothetical protein [Bacteroidia bacterium]
MGVSLAALGSGYSALRYRYGANALPNGMLRIPHAKQYFDVLPGFYTYICFMLLDVDYQIITKLKFFTLFELHPLYLV